MNNKEKYLDYCIKVRRTLHKIPETGFDLPETTKIITNELDKLHIQYYTGVGKSSIVAIIKGNVGVPVIGFRADMDALFINEANDVCYRSTHVGKMHACGHDCHVAILLTTLKYLVEEKVDFPGTVKAIFQACEEGPGSGGMLVCEDKLMDDVETFFALHVDPTIKSGTIKVRPREFNASCDDFYITLIGKSCHAAYPHLGIDPLQMGVEVYQMIQNMRSRELPQSDKVVISISGMNCGTGSNNIIPDECQLIGTVRTYNKDLKKIIKDKMEEILMAVSSRHHGSYKFEYLNECIPLINDPETTEFVIKMIKENLGEEFYYTDNFYSMGVDDFAYYTDKTKGVMFNLGTNDGETKNSNSLHNCHFDVDEKALLSGVIMFLSIIKNYRGE